MLQECFKPIEFSLKCCVPAEVYAEMYSAHRIGNTVIPVNLTITSK
jgi:hypothetical protein